MKAKVPGRHGTRAEPQRVFDNWHSVYSHERPYEPSACRGANWALLAQLTFLPATLLTG
jgi:hypothetical protein